MPEYEKHSAQKPEALLERIVKASSNAGDIVLDPFGGTFTTCAVAQRLKRVSIGIELQIEFVKIGLRRLGIADHFEGERLHSPKNHTPTRIELMLLLLRWKRNRRTYSMGPFKIARHYFTQLIFEILEKHFGEYAGDIFERSPILGYLNYKTRAASRGSKARGSFGNHYALYVVVEDYIRKGFPDGIADETYNRYEGARFSDLLRRQRQLPFGSKLQNHALNSRLNDEFRKYYPTVEIPPIVRDVETQRYWVQEDLLLVTIRQKNGEDRTYNIAHAVIDIIEKYVETKRAAFETFLDTCQQLAALEDEDSDTAVDFVLGQLAPNVDARVFEIVSYAVLKAKYRQETIWIGRTREDICEEMLMLYKTGRTNANDGGIDFVMRPIGRFFQVTETIDASKYFLDIDKIQRFPITFVVKSNQSADRIREDIRNQAVRKYKIESVVESYLESVEEIINVNDLVNDFRYVVKSGQLESVMEEIIVQSKVEFNYED